MAMGAALLRLSSVEGKRFSLTQALNAQGTTWTL